MGIQGGLFFIFIILHRGAIDQNDGEPRLFTQAIDIALKDNPINMLGFLNVTKKALESKGLSNMQKMKFVKQKLEVMQEFGDIHQYREALDQLKTYKRLCATDLKAEAKKRKELEREEMRLKELEELRAQTRAQANWKAKMAESEGKLLCTQCQVAMYPNAEGLYEFEGFQVLLLYNKVDFVIRIVISASVTAAK